MPQVLQDVDGMARQGPREKLIRHDPRTLSDAELLAVVLGTGSSGEHVTVLAARVLASLHGVQGLQDAGVRHLSRIRGIGHAKAARVAAAVELGRRVRVPSATPKAISHSAQVHAMFAQQLHDRPVEHFFALSLDAGNRPITQHEIARGGRAVCQVDTAEVFRLLLRDAASGAIFIHNHPSGDPTPSEDDVALTRALVAAGHLLQIRVVDHVVIAGNRHYSFEQQGLLQAWQGPAKPP